MLFSAQDFISGITCKPGDPDEQDNVNYYFKLPLKLKNHSNNAGLLLELTHQFSE
jgi:hypothetical protein